MDVCVRAINFPASEPQAGWLATREDASQLTVGVAAGVGHGEEAGALVLDLEVFVLELLAWGRPHVGESDGERGQVTPRGAKITTYTTPKTKRALTVDGLAAHAIAVRKVPALTRHVERGVWAFCWVEQVD